MRSEIVDLGLTHDERAALRRVLYAHDMQDLHGRLLVMIEGDPVYEAVRGLNTNISSLTIAIDTMQLEMAVLTAVIRDRRSGPITVEDALHGDPNTDSQPLPLSVEDTQPIPASVIPTDPGVATRATTLDKPSVSDRLLTLLEKNARWLIIAFAVAAGGLSAETALEMMFRAIFPTPTEGVRESLPSEPMPEPPSNLDLSPEL